MTLVPCTYWWTAPAPSSAGLVSGFEQHGTKTRPSWRKLHIGMDADTGQIVAATLTNKERDDGAEVGPLP